jgi:hypothetical protein
LKDSVPLPVMLMVLPSVPAFCWKLICATRGGAVILQVQLLVKLIAWRRDAGPTLFKAFPNCIGKWKMALCQEVNFQ